MSGHPVARLRLRLTAWYAGTLGMILVLLGTGLFLAIQHQLKGELDASLRAATAEAIRAARIRELESAQASGAVVDAFDELRIPDRQLFLLDSAMRPIKPPAPGSEVLAGVRRALAAPDSMVTLALARGRTLRLNAQRFRVDDGRAYVAAAAADRVELEERYAALIAAFAVAAVVAVVLVAAGGWFLAGKSAAPIERNMEQMRRFMADAAHELRTPITVLRSRAEIAQQRPRGAAEYAEALAGIEREAMRLGGIVDDLLLLARADAGDRPVRRERFFLDDVTIDAVGAARAVAERRGVTLVVDELEEAAVTGDATLVRQIVMILLDNATKFTPAGGAVHVSVTDRDGGPTLTVADTGVGIPAEQLPRIFERFHRVDPNRSRGDGAGLGLSIAKWIADVHQATLTVTSDVDQGTTVTVRFRTAG